MINVEDSSLFEIACNQILPNELLVRFGTSEVLLKIALPEIVLQFVHFDLFEDQVQWQRFSCLVDLVDRNAIPGQVAKVKRRTRSEEEKRCTRSIV